LALLEIQLSRLYPIRVDWAPPVEAKTCIRTTLNAALMRPAQNLHPLEIPSQAASKSAIEGNPVKF
jgi:hypothetical protein